MSARSVVARLGWALVVVGVACAALVGCGASSSGAEPEGGYANVFLSRTEPGGWDLELAVRSQQGEGAWTKTAGVLVGRSSFEGVGVAERPGGTETLLGYTVDRKMTLRRGKGVKFGKKPVGELKGVAAGPAIAHVTGSSWLVAYRPNGGGVEVRPFDSRGGGGLGSPLDLSGVEGTDELLGRPAIAYADGRLAMVWGRSKDNYAYRYLAADYEPATGAVEIVDQGKVEKPTRKYAGFAAEPRSSPALTTDGTGAFYLAAIYRGVPGQPFNTVRIYSSRDGSEWQMMDRPFPGGNSFHTGWSHIGLAARNEGGDDQGADLLLTVISGSGGERTLQFSAAGGYWKKLSDERDAFFDSSPIYYIEGISAIGLASPEGE